MFRRALAIGEQIDSGDHPRTPNFMNNLCTVLIMQEKVDEAKELLARAWQLKAGRHDITSTRLLYVRIAGALIAQEPIGNYIGRLKTLLVMDPLPEYVPVAKPWNIQAFNDNVRKRTPSYSADILDALAAALNDPDEISTLDQFPIWAGQSALPLEA